MRKLLLIYLTMLATSLVGTLVFLVRHLAIFGQYGALDWLNVLLHCVPQHLTVIGYSMVLPLLLGGVNIWLEGLVGGGVRRSNGRRESRRLGWFGRFMQWYMPVVAVVLCLLWAVNLELYSYWGIVLDSTVLIYLLDNPVSAIAESPLWVIIVGTLFCAGLGWLVASAIGRLYDQSPQTSGSRYSSSSRSSILVSFFTSPSSMPGLVRTVVWLLLCGFDFLAIRGGWTTATMNPGRAYFSNEMPLNHAAVDPVFNFVYSVSRQEDFSKQYRFMSDEEAERAMKELKAMKDLAVKDEGMKDLKMKDEGLVGDEGLGEETLVRPQLLNNKRPNILLVIFESFSGSACQYLTADADFAWMPNVNRCMEEGVAFTRFYSNSFRTDRGVASILASYPGQPTHSVMKNQSKCNNLQYFTSRLRKEGYDLEFIHGGDVNFTNMQGFLRAAGFGKIVGDSDFPLSDRQDKWGVRDDLMFPYVARQIQAASHPEPDEDDAKRDEASKPWLKVFLTLSSHEPFEVPYHHFDNIYLNSVAYTDSCFGSFIDELKADPAVWDNLLVIGLPDHCFARFPETILQHEPMRYHSPMFWMGGALSETLDADGRVTTHREVNTLGQQTDLAATLLGQMGIDASEFNFSKDMLDPRQSHYAFYAFSDGFGLITDGCSYVQDNNNPGVGLTPGTDDPQGQAERWGKAYLQRLYDDLQRR